jgi:hypothetical protein
MIFIGGILEKIKKLVITLNVTAHIVVTISSWFHILPVCFYTIYTSQNEMVVFIIAFKTFTL